MAGAGWDPGGFGEEGRGGRRRTGRSWSATTSGRGRRGRGRTRSYSTATAGERGPGPPENLIAHSPDMGEIPRWGRGTGGAFLLAGGGLLTWGPGPGPGRSGRTSPPRREHHWDQQWQSAAPGYTHGWRDGGWNPHAAPRSTRPWLAHLGVNVGGVDDPVLHARARPGARRRPAGEEWGDPDGNATGPLPDPYVDDVKAGVRFRRPGLGMRFTPLNR